MRRALLVLMTAVPLGAQSPAPLPYDSRVVRSLLSEAMTVAGRVHDSSRSSLLSAIGRTQVTARDFAGAARTLTLVRDEPLASVARYLGESVVFAGLHRAGLARQLSCGLYEADRPADALAAVRAMRPGAQRDWELAHIVALTVSGARRPEVDPAPPVVDGSRRWHAALALADEIRLPEARLDAFVAITNVIPDSADARPNLVRAYEAARRITLTDGDRQRSRDALLAIVALRLERQPDVRTLFARLSNSEDMALVLAAAADRRDSRQIVRELAPRTIAAGRAIRDSAARRVYLTQLWQSLQTSDGRGFADSLLHEATGSADRPRNLRALMDSAAAADMTPVAQAKRALHTGDYAEIRRQLARIPLDDRAAKRAALWRELAWEVYSGRPDTARAYMIEARTALRAAPRDSAISDGLASSIAALQFLLDDNDQGLVTLNLVRSPEAAQYTVSEWGKSTFSKVNARRLRDYADRVRNASIRDAVLARVVNGYLVGDNAKRADIAWGAALADSIATPVYRIQAIRDVADDALRRGDSAGARRRLLKLFQSSTAPGESAEQLRSTLVDDIIGAGAWREAVAWARSPASPGLQARRLRRVAGSLQRQIDLRRDDSISFSNGPDWCLDGF